MQSDAIDQADQMSSVWAAPWHQINDSIHQLYVPGFGKRGVDCRDWSGSTKKSQRILCVYKLWLCATLSAHNAPKAGQLIMHGGQPAAAFCPFNLRQMRPLFARSPAQREFATTATAQRRWTSKSKRESRTTFARGLLSPGVVWREIFSLLCANVSISAPTFSCLHEIIAGTHFTMPLPADRRAMREPLSCEFVHARSNKAAAAAQLYLFIDDVRYSNFIARRAPPNLTHEISIAQVTKHSANK